MDEEWVKIYAFPSYSVSNYGRVRNDATQKLLKPSYTKQGATKVNLVIGGISYTRSIKVLVAEGFLGHGTEHFNTPMLLDGDQRNCRADNIVWRPLWFAWKYARQFERSDYYTNRGPLMDRKTEDVYENIYQAAIQNGLLFVEVHLALTNKTPVFPTWQMFDWIKE